MSLGAAGDSPGTAHTVMHSGPPPFIQTHATETIPGRTSVDLKNYLVTEVYRKITSAAERLLQ